MAFTFDGVTRRVILTAGTTEFTVEDLWSRWVDWYLTGDNSKYLPAMRSVGGDPISATKSLGSSFFMINDWRIRPQEADHWLRVTGNLFTDPAGSSPYVPTLGVFNVTIEATVSNLSDVTTVSTGGSALTEAEHDQLMGLPTTTLLSDERTQLLAIPLESGLTPTEHDQLMALYPGGLTPQEHDQLMALPVDALGEALVELLAAPPANPTPKQVLMLLYMMARDKVISAPNSVKLHTDAGVLVATGVVSVAGDGTVTREKLV